MGVEFFPKMMTIVGFVTFCFAGLSDSMIMAATGFALSVSCFVLAYWFYEQDESRGQGEGGEG